MGEKIQIRFDKIESVRLDKYLVELRIQELYSRTFIEKLISEDLILVNNIPVKKSYLLNKNDLITIHLPDPQPLDIVPQDIPLEIIYEDEYLAVINKQAGMIIHPGYGNPDNTLANAIVFRYGANLTKSISENRPGIVHRLDRGTSGLVLIAKDDATLSHLSTLFSKREVQKIYLAITSGVPAQNSMKIETYLSRSISNPRKIVVSDFGKWALTQYKILHYYINFALLEVKIDTGRMHQIRVHLADLKYPILGDLLYNSIKYVQSLVPDNMKRKVYDLLTNHLHRQALHAWKLSFIHPYTNKLMKFTAPLPKDIIYTLDWLEQHFAIDKLSYREKLDRVE